MCPVIGRCMLIALALVPLLTAGCGNPTEPEDVTKQRISLAGLAIAYGQCTAQNRGRPPRSEKALRGFIEKQGPEFLARFDAETIDDLFVSPRDGEPYVVVYGKTTDIVAYEAVGVDGKRWIAHNLGGAEEVDEATFREKVPNAK